jgi:hypothetical protein
MGDLRNKSRKESQIQAIRESEERRRNGYTNRADCFLSKAAPAEHLPGSFTGDER